MRWLRQFGERETWCTDTQEAITAEVAAALGITQALAASYLDYSRSMRGPGPPLTEEQRSKLAELLRPVPVTLTDA